MISVDIKISCAIRGAAPISIVRTTTVSQENLDMFFPRPAHTRGSYGWGYWPRREETERLVYSILKEELFKDEVTPIQSESDLRRLGVTHLSLEFDSKDVQQGMNATLIPHR